MFIFELFNCKSIKKDELFLTKEEFVEIYLKNIKPIMDNSEHNDGCVLKCNTINQKKYVVMDGTNSKNKDEVILFVELEDFISLMDEYSERQFTFDNMSPHYIVINYVFGGKKKQL